jgi:import inner membrane translocase subunit TIM10
MSSWFGGSAEVKVPQPSQLDLARTELELMTDMFNRCALVFVLISTDPPRITSTLSCRMVDLCFQKCVDSRAYKDGELNVGEMSCTDRCVGKYLEASIRVGERLQKLEQQNAAGGGR